MWLSSLIIALRYWLQIKAVTAEYDLEQRKDKDFRELEDEITRLRNAGDPDSQLAADSLHKRLVRLRGIAAKAGGDTPATAASSPPQSGAGGGNG